MKRLIFFIVIIAVFSLSCGNGNPTTGVTSDLGKMLSAIPSSASGNMVWFSSMKRIKELAGVAPDTDMNEYVSTLNEKEVYKQRMYLFAGYALSPFTGESYMKLWPDTFGFSAFDTTQEVWAESRVATVRTGASFSIMKGNFDRTSIIDKFNGLGYQRKSREAVDYYSVNADNQVGDIKSSHAASIAMANLNRMLVEETEIVAAPADEVFFSVLDVRAGKLGSLKDSAAYTRTAEVLGDVLGAALIPPGQLLSENVAADWGALHGYDLAGIGYRVEGQERKLTISLHYADNSAAADIEELNRRMIEYVLKTTSGRNSHLIDLFDIGKPEATVYGTDSILKTELVYKDDTRETLWSEMVTSQELGFLAVNPVK